jgi:hypothetical protein
MLRFVSVDTLIKPLHSASYVGGLVGGVVENRVSQRNPQRAEQDQGDDDDQCAALKEIFDAGEQRRTGLDLDAFLPGLLFVGGGHFFLIIKERLAFQLMESSPGLGAPFCYGEAWFRDSEKDASSVDGID